jgi:hypothetical protein
MRVSASGDVVAIGDQNGSYYGYSGLVVLGLSVRSDQSDALYHLQILWQSFAPFVSRFLYEGVVHLWSTNAEARFDTASLPAVLPRSGAHLVDLLRLHNHSPHLASDNLSSPRTTLSVALPTKRVQLATEITQVRAGIVRWSVVSFPSCSAVPAFLICVLFLMS